MIVLRHLANLLCSTTLALCTCLLLFDVSTALASGDHHEASETHETHEAHEATGPNGGRLLTHDSGFGLEMTIYEPGIPPQSRVYPTFNGKPIPTQTVALEVVLKRLTRKDLIKYTPHTQFLLGDKNVEEPHSFDVEVKATYQNRTYHWTYGSYEGRVTINGDSAKLAGIKTAKVEPRTMNNRIPVLGQVGFNQDAVQHISAPYSATVVTLGKSIGDTVTGQETLGTLLGSESLSQFRLVSPGPGRVVEKLVTVGEVVNPGQILFAIADLNTVWVDFTVYRSDAARVHAGQPVTIMPGDDLAPIEGTLAYLAPVGDAPSQSVTARALVPNPAGQLRPGLFVQGSILVGTTKAPMAVQRKALQTLNNNPVVFLNRNTTYEAAIVKLGAVDGDHIEILSGLNPGDTYVADHSFVIKAELGKAGAAHHHH